MGFFHWISRYIGGNSPGEGAGKGEADAESNALGERLIEEGNVLEEQGKFAEAIEKYRAALTALPESARVFLNLGNAFLALNQTEQATANYRKALCLQPDSSKAYFNLGLSLSSGGDLAGAVAAYRDALRFNPDFLDAHIALACALEDQGDQQAALAQYRIALGINPVHGPANFNLGMLLYGLGEVEEAIARMQTAAQDPGFCAGAHGWLGKVYLETGLVEKAVEHYRLAHQFAPEDVAAFSNYLFSLNFLPDISADRLLQEHLEYARVFSAPALVVAEIAETDIPRKLRVGYVSGDFFSHPVARFFEPLLEHHDRNRFELVCYYNNTVVDATTLRLRQSADGWRAIEGLNDLQVCDLIRRDAIDILVDLSGHTARGRLTVFARKPAPLQLTWLGYLGTTGISAVDYRICDVYTDPPGMTESAYVEKLARLPHSQWCYRPPVDLPSVNDSPMIQNGFLTFGSFNNPTKINLPVIALWARVLAALPDAHMVIGGVRNSFVAKHLVGAFGGLGIAAERLELIGGQRLEDYFLAYRKVDVVLDPFPYNGATTTLDALLMGVPVITLAGCRSLARGGVSLLSNLGLGDFIASAEDEYANKAVSLASQSEYLACLRFSLREMVRNSPLMDETGFANAMESLFLDLWSCRGNSATGPRSLEH
ncbi:MAG: TPR repeat-containing protein YrrB [Betaproteobacteria bacterium ADurb.Bin341]|nr:MAG: TPR repeat-containing protein YrrB [Betaproteobacteria bacterium ADurb.Bin341]